MQLLAGWGDRFNVCVEYIVDTKKPAEAGFLYKPLVFR